MPFKDPQKRKEYLNNWQRALKDDPMLVKRALEYLEAFYVRTDSAIS
jgi:hypothetical protein